MEEVFDKLRNLQDILSKKFQIENEIKDIPRNLSTKSELLARLKKTYIEKNEQYDAVKARLKSIKQKMIDAEQEREKYEKQMDEIKTQREYEALDKEIRDASEREQQLRKEMQREEKVLEDMAKSLEREETMIKQQEEDLALEQDKIKNESAAKGSELKDLEKEEKKLVPGLDEEMIFKFERIIRSKAGVGIVPLKKGVCTGCHMILPMQFVNDVRNGELVRFCPYCSRVLFFQTEEESFIAEEETEGLADLVDEDELLDMDEDDTLEIDDGVLSEDDEADEEIDTEEDLDEDLDGSADDEDDEDEDLEEDYE
ncbi:MAG: zinc ribbon domain-containing protein [Spirochaetia bacterium]